jgi:hypothetical protein
MLIATAFAVSASGSSLRNLRLNSGPFITIPFSRGLLRWDPDSEPSDFNRDCIRWFCIRLVSARSAVNSDPLTTIPFSRGFLRWDPYSEPSDFNRDCIRWFCIRLVSAKSAVNSDPFTTILFNRRLLRWDPDNGQTDFNRDCIRWFCIRLVSAKSAVKFRSGPNDPLTADDSDGIRIQNPEPADPYPV